MCDTWVIQWAQVSEWDDHHVGAMIIYFKRTKLNLRWWITCDESLFWKKNTANKNQGWEPIHQKYKANENTSKHNPKKKEKHKSHISGDVHTCFKTNCGNYAFSVFDRAEIFGKWYRCCSNLVLLTSTFTETRYLIVALLQVFFKAWVLCF